MKKKNSRNVSVCGMCVRACLCGHMHTFVCWATKQWSSNNLHYFSFPGSLSAVLSGVTRHTHTRKGSRMILGAFPPMGEARHLE